MAGILEFYYYIRGKSAAMKLHHLVFATIFVFATLGCHADGGYRVVTDTIHSTILNAPRAYTAVVPEAYYSRPDSRFPVVYLLHGMYGDNEDWTIKGHAAEICDSLAALGKLSDVVIITPCAGGENPEIQQHGYFNIPDWAYEDFFFNELVPQVEQRFRAGGSKSERAIAGLSMGGGGTTVYAQRHPDKFAAAWAMSALMSLPAERDPGKLPDTSKVRPYYQSVVDLDCTKFLESATPKTIEALKTVKWYQDCGDNDFLRDINLDYYKALRRAGIDGRLIIRPGAHTWEFWRTSLPNALTEFDTLFKQAR